MATQTTSNAAVIARFYDKVASENLVSAPLFGHPLAGYMDEQKKKMPFLNVPWIVRKCVDYLLANALKTEGLFRVPGSHSVVTKLQEFFDQGKNFNFEDVPAFAEDVSGVLKKYLRDMPEPLLSDGTADDSLQGKFGAALALGPEQMVTMFKILLKQLPVYRKALTYDLFYLLARVAAFSSVNLMSPDNLATIFGGMGDIISNKMNPSERAFCCRFMIENFDAIFDGVLDLTPRPDDASLNNVREGIKIYLVDGTFKALICVGSESAKDIAGKTAQKLQQQLNIDCSTFKLYELRDTFVRLMGDSEKVLAVQKTQSALIFTNQLNPDEKRAISEFAAPPAKFPRQASTLNAATLRGDKLERSDSKDKSDKLEKSEGKDKTKTREKRSNTSRGQRQTSKSKIDRLETSASSDGDSSSLVFSSWAFFGIPAESSRASEWDTEKAQEADVLVSGPDTDRVVRVLGGGKDIPCARLNVVDDSSRYFVATSSTGERIGLGFETREDASKFRHCATHLFVAGSSASAGASAGFANDTEFSGKATAAGEAYWKGPVDFYGRIEDGFYDCGMQTGGESQPSMEELLKRPVDLGGREVILVNSFCDPRLARMTQVALDLARGASDLTSKLCILALFVSNIMGGTDVSTGLCALEEQQDARTTLSYLSATSINNLKKRYNTNVVKLGHITHGVARHRALLFKYLCDRLDPAVPVSLLRSDANKYEGDLTWNYVAGFKPHHFVYIDLMHDPGRIYHASSAEVQQITAALHGSLDSLTDVSAAMTALRFGGRTADLAAAATLEPVSGQILVVAAPAVSSESSVHVFEQIGSGPDSRTYRGIIGTGLPVCIKETPKSKGDNLLAYSAYKTQLQHPNILPFFGQQITASSFRVISALSGKRSLKDHVRERKTWGGEIPEEQILVYAVAVCDALDYLHEKQYFHGLLRCSNIIVDGSLEPFSLVQLTDMLISPAHLPLYVSKKRQRWWAPEAARAAASGDFNFDYRASDIWSLGMVLVELVTLRAPYAGLTAEDVSTCLAEGRMPPSIPAGSPILPFIEQCLQVDASKRPTAKDLGAAIRAKFSS